MAVWGEGGYFFSGGAGADRERSAPPPGRTSAGRGRIWALDESEVPCVERAYWFSGRLRKAAGVERRSCSGMRVFRMAVVVVEGEKGPET